MGTSLVERLLFIVDADTRGGVVENDKWTDSAQRVADKATIAKARVADLEATIARRRNGPSAEQAAKLGILQRKAADADAAVARLAKSSGQGVQSVGRLGQASQMAGNLGLGRMTAGMSGATLGAAALAAGVAVAAKTVQQGISDYVTLAGSVREFQRASGASAEDSSRFVAVLDDLGIDAGKASAAVFKLGKTVADNPGKLRALGIEVERNADGSANLTGTLLNVADAYAASSDQAERARIANAAFGKGGRELLPMLEQGRVGLERYFASAETGRQIMSQEDLDRAREFELAVDSLGDSLGGISRTIGEAAIGPVSDFVAGLAAIVDWTQRAADRAEKFADRFSWVGKAAGFVGRVATAGTGPVALLGEAVMDLGSNANDTAEKERELADATTRAAQAQSAAVAAAQARSDALANAGIAAAQAILTEERAAVSLQSAHLSVAQARLGVLRVSQAAAEQAVEQARNLRNAEETVASARERLADATADVAAAQKAYSQTVRGYGAASEEAASAQERLNDAMRAARGAHLDVAESFDRAEDALAAYNEAVAMYGANSEEATDAERAYQRAQLDKEAAQDRARKAAEEASEAEKGYADTVRGTGPDSDEARDALERLTDAKRAERDASRSVRNAVEAQGRAHRASVDDALAAQQAMLTLRNAELALRDAYLSQARALADREKAAAAAAGELWTDTQYALALGNAIEFVTQKIPALREALAPFIDPVRVGLWEDSRKTAEQEHHAEQADRARDTVGAMARDSVRSRSGAPTTIVLEVNGRQFAEATVDDFRTVERGRVRRGAALS